jgi:predicted ATPase
MLHQPERPKVLVIDEPELGLHPFAITHLANLFRSVATEANLQIVAATQSTAFVNQLVPSKILAVDRDERDASTFRRPTDGEIAGWLEAYGLGDLSENVIGGRPR